MQATVLEVLIRLQIVWDKFSAANMKVNLEKCSVFPKNCCEPGVSTGRGVFIIGEKEKLCSAGSVW